MKLIIAWLLTVFIFLCPSQLCFAGGKAVTADTLTREDVIRALLAGEITSNCRMGGVPDAGATSLNPGSIIIKGIFQDGYEATIHFMGRLKKSARSGGRPVVCEADLVRLNSGEWQDPDTGNILER